MAAVFLVRVYHVAEKLQSERAMTAFFFVIPSRL
jgi:hypothetical protein